MYGFFLMIEDCIEIPGYRGYYAFCDGFIVSTKYNEPRILKTRINGHKYPYVNLCQNGKYKSICVHRIIAMVFLKDFDHEHEVNHIDGNKCNSNIRNLEMVSKEENMQHAVRMGLKKPPQVGENHWCAKLTTKDVIQIRNLYDLGYSIKSILEKYNNVSRRCIKNIVKGKTWKHI